jgi:alkane 1-monooxygenase
VLAHYGGDVEQANIHPRARKRVLARHGSPGPAADGA